MEFLPQRRTTVDPVRAAMQANRRALVGVAIFSAIINVLLLTSPIFMLQVYDRVLTSRSHADADGLARHRRRCCWC